MAPDSDSPLVRFIEQLRRDSLELPAIPAGPPHRMRFAAYLLEHAAKRISELEDDLKQSGYEIADAMERGEMEG